MRLYEAKGTPNCARVDIYLSEKGLDIPRVPISLKEKDNKTPDYLAKNPIGKVPLLELDDGSYLPESIAIIEYLEELHPESPMIGTTPAERAQVRASERIANEIFTRMAFILLNTHPSVPTKRPGFVQRPDAAEILGPSMDALLDQLEQRIGDQPFLAGPRPTIADCTLFALLKTNRDGFGQELPERLTRLRAWYDRFAQRPSAQY